jgi:hypothetical protein
MSLATDPWQFLKTTQLLLNIQINYILPDSIPDLFPTLIAMLLVNLVRELVQFLGGAV